MAFFDYATDNNTNIVENLQLKKQQISINIIFIYKNVYWELEKDIRNILNFDNF